MEPLVDLRGMKVIITGASQGIGRETAIFFSKLGAQGILIARNEEKLKNTIAQMEGENHSYYVYDLSCAEYIEDLMKKIALEQGVLDGMVYCAGISDDRPLGLMKPQFFENVIRVNVGSFVEMVRCLAKKKRYNIGGVSVVGISSVSAFAGTKAHEAYATSKAGMNGAVRCMAKELADKKIRVNTVAPGMIKTEMYENYLSINGGIKENANQNLLKRQYLGIGKPEDVASVAAFLMSSASKFITGICIPVDGGYTSN